MSHSRSNPHRTPAQRQRSLVVDALYSPQGELRWRVPAETEIPEVNRDREMFAALQAVKPIDDSLSMAW
jgi:hypothetical protein